ncbi:MAG TPA: type II secretion system protein [Candidatus Paceibacterota bacterium]|nr:type II secretion system protein [Candidatus Paceibacterota bacterium]
MKRQLSTNVSCSALSRRPAGLPSRQAGLLAGQAGFTLIEMLVSITLFAIVMVVCIATLLSLVTANKKAQALQSVVNNLNISLDEMVRAMRQGSHFDGSGSGCVSNGDGQSHDCTGGTNAFKFIPYGVDPSVGPATIYAYEPNGTDGCVTIVGTGGCIVQSLNNGVTYTVLTAPEVSITDMKFYVIDTTAGDANQPRVIITIDGTAGGVGVKTTTTFHLQATALQRLLDL